MTKITNFTKINKINRGGNSPLKPNIMKNTIKRLHRQAGLEVKIGLPILVLVILPLLISLTVKLLQTKNIIF